MTFLPTNPDSNDDLDRSAQFNDASTNKNSNPNDVRILEVLTKQGPLTRKQLVKETEIARSTIYDSLLRLMLKKYVSKYSEKPRGPGRPKVFFQIREDEPSSTPAPLLTW